MTIQGERAGGLNRWGLVGGVFAATAAMSAATLAWHPGLTGVRDMIALTARVAVVLFCAAFGASSIYHFWPASRWSRWQFHNRRYLGISFAVVQTIHIAFVITFATVATEVFVVANGWWGNTILAGLAYAFVMAMGLTSFDRSAAWLGRARWSLLHKVGGYYIWLIFLIAFGKRALAEPYSAPGVATLLLLIVLGLRLTVAAYQSRRPSAKVGSVAPP